MRRACVMFTVAFVLVVSTDSPLVRPTVAAQAPREVVVETITYGSNGIELGGILARPRDLTGKAPAILAMHGGGNSGLQRAMEWLVTRLAARGYVALSGTYRQQAGPGFGREDLADCRMAVDYLAALPYVDANRIGMTGQSRGAGNSFRMGLHDPRVKSISPIAGGSGGLPGVQRPNPRELSEQRFMENIRSAGGFPEELPAPEPAAPPANPLDIKIPQLVIQGTWDLHAPAEGALVLRDLARQRGVSTIKVHVIEGMGHFFDTPKGDLLDEIAALQADWFDETLLGRTTGRDFEKPLDLPDTPTWPASPAFTVSEVTYDAKGARVPAYLVTPNRSGDVRSAVVYAPDGHTGAEATRLGFVIEALAGSGHVVLVTRWRGPVGDLTDDDDVVGALDFLASRAGVDRNRLSVVGHGRGGMAALRTAARDPRIKAVVALAAPANLTRLIQGLEAYSPAAARFQASRFADKSRYAKLSPHYYARSIKVPVLLVHGSLDLMVAPEHMLWNAVGLMTTGNSRVELYMAPWDIHHFDSTFAYLKPGQWADRIPSFLARSTGPGSH